MLESRTLDLQSWNIWIRNLRMTDPDRLSDFVDPYLTRKDSSDYTELFADADLRNTSTFLSHFRPNEPLFKWTLPKGIDFSQIDMEGHVEESSLEEIAHFLFNFRYIKRPERCRHFAKHLIACEGPLTRKIENSSLEEIDYFFWNWWLALPDEEDLPLLTPERYERLIERTSKVREDRAALLGIAGTRILEGEKWSGIGRILEPSEAFEITKTALFEPNPRAIRYLAAYHAAFTISQQKANVLCDKLSTLELHLDIPKQNRAVNALLERLDCTFDSKEVLVHQLD